MPRPVLYLDVDGPLNPHSPDPDHTPPGFTAHRMTPDSWIVQHPGTPRDEIKPLRVLLNPAHGPRLAAFQDEFELIWATAWGDDANTFIAPVIGLPRLPVVIWPDGSDGPPKRLPGPGGELWKTTHLVAHAAGRPFAWLDDEVTATDRAYVRTHHKAPALLHRVDARRGLQDADFDAITAFAATVRHHTDPVNQ